jgi:hypothetical protein
MWNEWIKNTLKVMIKKQKYKIIKVYITFVCLFTNYHNIDYVC